MSRTPSPTPAPPSPTPSPSPTPVPATETPVPGETASPVAPEESILILSPGPGARVVSPILVSGLSDPAPDQQVLVELIAEDGATIAQQAAAIQADAGVRGPFSVELPFTGKVQRARVQVSIRSARDGGLVHLSSTPVQLLASGAPVFVPGQIHTETVFISGPQPGAVLIGGSVTVSGIAVASFEQTLAVEVQDENGTVVGQASVLVQAPAFGGQPGPFSVNVPYAIGAAQVGRVVVKDVSVGIPGLIHLSSVEVTLQP